MVGSRDKMLGSGVREEGCEGRVVEGMEKGVVS